MAYSPTTVSPNDTITDTVVEGNIADFRTEVNTTKLNKGDFTDGVLKSRHIAKPRLESYGGGLMEWRGESGGYKSVVKGPMNATHVEDRIVINKSDAAYSLAMGAANPANSGYSLLTHQGGGDDSSADPLYLSELPGLSLTIDVPSPCRVILRGQTIINLLPSSTSGTSNYATANPTPQPLFLLQLSPNTTDPSIVSVGRSITYSQKTQLDMYLTNLYWNGFVDISTPGTYSFKVVANIQPNGQGNYETKLGLIGKTTFSAEWWYTKPTNN